MLSCDSRQGDGRCVKGTPDPSTATARLPCPLPGKETDLLPVPTVFPGAEHERPAAFPPLVEALQAITVDAQVKAPGLASPLRRLLVVVAMATAAPAVAVPVRHGRARGDTRPPPRSNLESPPAARAHVNKSEGAQAQCRPSGPSPSRDEGPCLVVAQATGRLFCLREESRNKTSSFPNGAVLNEAQLQWVYMGELSPK